MSFSNINSSFHHQHYNPIPKGVRELLSTIKTSTRDTASNDPWIAARVEALRKHTEQNCLELSVADLVPPSGRLSDPIICILHWPTFRTNTPEYVVTADDSNCCMRVAGGALGGFHDVLWRDRINVRIQRPSGSKTAFDPKTTLSKDAQKQFEQFWFHVWLESSAKVGISWGKTQFQAYRKAFPSSWPSNLAQLPLYETNIHGFVEHTRVGVSRKVSRVVFMVFLPESFLQRGREVVRNWYAYCDTVMNLVCQVTNRFDRPANLFQSFMALTNKSLHIQSIRTRGLPHNAELSCISCTLPSFPLALEVMHKSSLK